MPFESPFGAIAPPPDDPENRRHWWNEGGPNDQAARFSKLAKPIEGPEPEGQGVVKTPAEMQFQRSMMPAVIDEGGYPGWDVHKNSMMGAGQPSSQVMGIEDLGNYLGDRDKVLEPRFRYAPPGIFDPKRLGPFE